MVERIIMDCNFQIEKGKTDIAIINWAMHDKEVVKEFLEAYIDAWNKWVGARGAHKISPFLEWVGENLFTDYLTALFHFNETIKAEVKRGNSDMECRVYIKYTYSDGELKKIKELKDKYNINHIKNEIELAKFLFSNCVKSIPKFLTNIMDIQYRLFTSRVDGNIKKDKSLVIQLVYDGRIA